MVRFVHPGEELPALIKRGIRSADVANTATGTEKNQLAKSAVVAVIYEYALGTQDTAPTVGWSTEPPAYVEGDFLWRRDTSVRGDGTVEVGSPYLATGPAGSDGAPGDPGAPGTPGVSVSSVTVFYYLSTTQPATPTVPTPPAPWTTTEPSYSPGSANNLYVVTRTVLSNNAFSYSPVSMSAAFAAAKAAFGKYTFSAAAPVTADGNGKPVGAMWVRKSVAGEIIGYWEWSGSAWQVRPLSQEIIPLIVADMISVGAIDGMTINGAELMGGLVRQQGTYNKNTVTRLTVPQNLASWVLSRNNGKQNSTIVSMDTDQPWFGPVPTPPAAVRSTSFEVGPQVVSGSALIGKSTIAVPTQFPNGVTVKTSAWVISLKVPKTIKVTWPDGFVQNIALIANQWTLITRTGVKSLPVLDIENPVNVFPINSVTLGVADVTFESTQGAVGRAELVTTSAGPSVVFSSGATAATLEQVGTVTPYGLTLAGVEVNDRGVTVPDGAAFASSGAVSVAGQTANIIGPDGVFVDGKLSVGERLRGTQSAMEALSAAGLAYDGLKFWRIDLNVPCTYIGGSWFPFGEQSLNLLTITVRSGYTIQGGSWAQKRSDGFVRGLLIVKRNSGAISGDTNGAALLTLPNGWKPSGAWEGSSATSQGGNASINFGQITTGGDVRVWNATAGNSQAAWQFEFMAA